MKSKRNSDHRLVSKIQKVLADHEFGTIDSDWTRMQKILISEKYNAFSEPHFTRINKQRNFILIGIAASMTLLAGFVYFELKSKHKTSPPESYITQNAVRRVNLPDGSLVVMNRDSKIEYSGEFGKNEREMYLTGEAFFQVQPDSNHPFKVYTSACEIMVLGTRFNVKAYPGEIREFITVESGIVKLISKSDTIADWDTLYSNETIVIDKGGSNFDKHQNEDPNYLSWKTKRLEFKDTPLIDVTRVLEELYGYKIILQSSDLDSVGLNAIYEDQEFHILLKTIAMTLDLEISEKNDTILLSRADE